MFENSKKEINENIVPGKNAGTSATGLKETLLAVLDDARDAISDANFGIIGAITTSQELSVLNSFPDGVYEAQTFGVYKNGLTAKEGYYTRFRKTANVWQLESETKIPAYDDTALKQRVTNTENKVDNFIENFAVEVDQEFNSNSTNAISNKEVTKIVDILDGFDLKNNNLVVNLLPQLTTAGLISENGQNITSTLSGRYKRNIPTNGAKYLRYKLSIYATQDMSFIWGIKPDNSKTLILAKSTTPVTIADEKDIDISQYDRLDVSYYFDRTIPPNSDPQYVDIYDEGSSEKPMTVKEYIDNKVNSTKLISYNKLSSRVISNANNDDVNTSFKSLKNIPLPKGTFKLTYKGGIGNPQANTSNFVPLLGVKGKGHFDVIIPSKAQNSSIYETVEVEIEEGKYSHISYCSRSNSTNVNNYDLIAHVKGDYKEILKKYINTKEVDVYNLPVTASTEGNWYTPYTQNNIVTYRDLTFGWFIEGSTSNLCVFKLNNSTGEFEYTNLTNLGLSITAVTKDNHNGFSLVIDKNGYLIIGGDCHGTPLKSVISNSPLSISSWKNISIVSSGQTKITYLRFIKKVDGKIFAIYRIGGSGNGNTWFCSYNEETWTFNNHYLLIDAISENAGNPYLQTPIIDRNGVIKIAFGFRTSASDVESMTGLFYIESADDGVTWRKSDGLTNYTLPIKKSTAERIFIADPGSGYINQNGACVDVNNNFATVTRMYKTINGVKRTIFVVIKKVGNDWVSQEVLNDSNLNSDFYAKTRARPMLFCNENNELIILSREVDDVRKFIYINTVTHEVGYLISKVPHEITFDNEYARDNFILKILVVNAPANLNTNTNTLYRFLNLSIIQSNLL